MDWSLIVASNNEGILKNCLAASPCAGTARDFQVMRGFASAGTAYNAGMCKASGDIQVFVHHDVYLPEGWDEQLAGAVARLSQRDPNWGVLGVWGIALNLKARGFIYCTGLQRVLGNMFVDPIACTSLDEVVLVIRQGIGVKFDERLPGYHLYGTDICLTAKQRGMNSYVIPAVCIHNTAGLNFLPGAFWQTYFYMRRKWRKLLPIRTPCTVISKWGMPFVDHPLRSAYVRYVKGELAGQRVEDVASLYRRLVDDGWVPHSVPTGAQIRRVI